MQRRVWADVDVLDRIHAGLSGRARQGAALLREVQAQGGVVTVVCHIDADGVSGGAIAVESLERAGIGHRVHPVRSLDDKHVEEILASRPDALWFTDLGSTVYMKFPGVPRLVCDHHDLVRDGSEEDFAHLNPRLEDLPGEDVSGAGAAFLVALALDAANLDLLPVALVGAAADLQDRRGGFQGTNRVFVEVGVASDLLEVEIDVGWFGIETRPLCKFLAYASDPVIPGAHRDQRGAEALLLGLGIDLRVDGRERTWGDLSDDERRVLRSALVNRLLDVGVSADEVDGLFQEVIRIRAEPPGTATRELREFGTLLNSTARYDRSDVGLAVARGDRGAALEEAGELLLGHRKHLVGALQAFSRRGIHETGALQWVHLEDDVRDTVVGIVCGMALEGLGLRRDKPLLGFAYTPDGRTKVSSRAPHELRARGIDLAAAMREGSKEVGGQGGGHQAAAGATIPRGSEQAFLGVVDGVVARQLTPS